MQVSGVERYDPVLVSRLARLNQGDIYDLNDLVQAQQRLASSGYFDSAYVFINPDNDPQAVPVQVQVREAKLQKWFSVLVSPLTVARAQRWSIRTTGCRVSAGAQQPSFSWRKIALCANRLAFHSRRGELALGRTGPH